MSLRNLTTVSLLILLLFCLFFSHQMEPWKAMIALMLSLYMNCKWLSLIYRKNKASVAYSKSYLFKWVGMDPEPFREKSKISINENSFNLYTGLGNTVFGFFLIQASAFFSEELWIVRGWFICGGLIFIVHFGTLKILAWNLRRNGFNVQPIMNLPVGAKKISEFWGGRWNRAFTQLVHPFIFSPFVKRFGPKYGVFATFFVSGLLHEIVISLPARSGWGLPTLYFVLQSLGMFVERTPFIKKGGTVVQILFTYLIVLVPAFLLFHPPFLKNIVLPLGRLLGANI